MPELECRIMRRLDHHLGEIVESEHGVHARHGERGGSCRTL
jgi:hypothetical protein